MVRRRLQVSTLTLSSHSLCPSFAFADTHHMHASCAIPLHFLLLLPFSWAFCSPGNVRVGDQGPSRSLQLMEVILDREGREKRCDLTVLAVLAHCQRINGREWRLDPQMLEDSHSIIKESADIWVRWLGAVTDTNPKLEVYEIEECVASWDGGRAMFPITEDAGRQIPQAIRDRVDQYIGIFPAQSGDGSSMMGGQGRYENQAMLLNDDPAMIRWRGQGRNGGRNARIDGEWTSVERRLYFSDWYSHEFLHWLAWKYRSEYDLEPYLHSWFNSGTWNANFDKGCTSEKCYVQQAMEKLFWVDDGVEPLVGRVKKSRECKSRGTDDTVMTDG